MRHYFLSCWIKVLLNCALIFCQHWIAKNIFGLAFATNGVEFLQLNKVSTGCILLGGLFLYDIFWVRVNGLLLETPTLVVIRPSQIIVDGFCIGVRHWRYGYSSKEFWRTNQTGIPTRSAWEGTGGQQLRDARSRWHRHSWNLHRPYASLRSQVSLYKEITYMEMLVPTSIVSILSW